MYECIVLCCLFDCRFGKITEWGPGGETVEVQESVSFHFLIYFHFTISLRLLPFHNLQVPNEWERFSSDWFNKVLTAGVVFYSIFQDNIKYSSCPQRFPQLIILRLKIKIFQTPVWIQGIDWRSLVGLLVHNVAQKPCASRIHMAGAAKIFFSEPLQFHPLGMLNPLAFIS